MNRRAFFTTTALAPLLAAAHQFKHRARWRSIAVRISPWSAIDNSRGYISYLHAFFANEQGEWRHITVPAVVSVSDLTHATTENDLLSFLVSLWCNLLNSANDLAAMELTGDSHHTFFTPDDHAHLAGPWGAQMVYEAKRLQGAKV